MLPAAVSLAEYLGLGPGTVATHVSDACADLKKALPDLAIVDDPDGHPAGGEEAR